jgi:hypothetical protein
VTVDQFKKLVETYRSELASLGREPARMNLTKKARDLRPIEIENHLLWMCDRILHEETASGVTNKTHRWLGFVQGCLFMLNGFSVEEMRSHSGVKEIP